MSNVIKFGKHSDNKTYIKSLVEGEVLLCLYDNSVNTYYSNGEIKSTLEDGKKKDFFPLSKGEYYRDLNDFKFKDDKWYCVENVKGQQVRDLTHTFADKGYAPDHLYYCEDLENCPFGVIDIQSLLDHFNNRLTFFTSRNQIDKYSKYVSEKYMEARSNMLLPIKDEVLFNSLRYYMQSELNDFYSHMEIFLKMNHYGDIKSGKLTVDSNFMDLFSGNVSAALLANHLHFDKDTMHAVFMDKFLYLVESLLTVYENYK